MAGASDIGFGPDASIEALEVLNVSDRIAFFVGEIRCDAIAAAPSTRPATNLVRNVGR
jgi:hypothetical protein